MASFKSHANVSLGVSIILWTAATCFGVGGVPFAGGTGEPNDPYQIATAEQFLAMRQSRDLPDKHFVLVADIDLDPALAGNAIGGTLLNLSSGSLDGRGHRILNVQIVSHERGGGPTPATLGPSAVVRNLSLEGVVAQDDSPVLARKNEGFVVNCSIEGTSCGIGLVEENAGYVIGCSVTNDANGESGLVGVNSGVVLYSHVTGGLGNTGGLIRDNRGTVSACYATSDVLGESDAGGLVGWNRGVISRCYATGDVFGEGAAGGLVGSNFGEISDCYALGGVSADLAGGLAASNTGSISRCYATGAGLIADSSWGGLAVSCYHLHLLDGGGSDEGLSRALTDLQMRQRESFIGWDFEGSSMDGTSDIWDMPEDGGYPILRTVQGLIFSGSGTAEDPYLIESAAQLPAVCHDLGAYYRLATDINLQGQSFSRPMIPIFWGHLDGDGHTLSNFTLTSQEDIGLFGILHADATVTNLDVYSVHVVATERTPGLIGVLAVHNYGRVSACSASVDSAVRGDVTNGYVGGLVAVNEDPGEIAGCFVSWAAAGWFERSGKYYWGGIAGHNIGSIVQCHASAFVGGSIAHCAVLVGQNDGSITDSYADGHSLRGGLVGTNRGEIANCHAATSVPHPPSIWTGGLVGEDLGGTIVNSYFLAQADGGGPDNGLGFVLSDAQMRQQASFTDWDFENVWMICEGQDYPRLQWENVDCGDELITGSQ